MYNEFELYDLLVETALKGGTNSVERVCKKFLKNKKKIGIVPQKRRKPNKSDLALALDHQNGRCARCGKKLSLNLATADHVFPLAQGGDNKNYLLQALCKPCNSSKGDNDPLEESKKSGRLIIDQLDGVIGR